MAKKKKIPERYQRWIDARKRYHLSHAHIQIVRELGLNPSKFDSSLPNTKQKLWKFPLPDFIEIIYFKHLRKISPIMYGQSSRWSKTITIKKKSIETGD